MTGLRDLPLKFDNLLGEFTRTFRLIGGLVIIVVVVVTTPWWPWPRRPHTLCLVENGCLLALLLEFLTFFGKVEKESLNDALVDLSDRLLLVIFLEGVVQR